MRSKPKSIRSRITVALLVPVVALSGLWGLDVYGAVTDAFALRNAYATGDHVGHPGNAMLEALQAERSRSQEFLAITPRNATALSAQRAATDVTVAEFRRLSALYDDQGSTADITRDRINDMIGVLSTLNRIRSQVDAGSITRAQALNAYCILIAYNGSVLSAAASFSDPVAERVMHTVVNLGQANELFSQEDALMTGAATAGRFGSGEYLELIKTVGAVRSQIPVAGFVLPEAEQAAYIDLLNSPSFRALRLTEDQIIRDGRPGGQVPINLEGWKTVFNPVAEQILGFLANAYDAAVAAARAAGDRILARFALTGGLGMIAILLSLFLAARVGRSVVNRLSELRVAAIDLAGRELPEVVARLRAGEQVDVDRDALFAPPGGDEISDVGLALSEVRRSATASAVGEAALRQGMGKVLVNIARRNQTLLDRQLNALAQMRASGGSAEPQQAAVAEQMAIRMRRQAEHLVILAGSARSQGGFRPLPLTEIIGSAADDVENAGRIETGPVVDVEVPGRMAADIVHLLTELLENATAFSPPDTPVRVSAQRGPHGVTVEIEDRGLGMTPSALQETNRMLAQPPDFDPANSARLGLLVVAQLAAQRGIGVHLQTSAFDGITAVVVLPPGLAEAAAGAAPGSPGQPAPAPRRLNASRLVGVLPARSERVASGSTMTRDRPARHRSPVPATPSRTDDGVLLAAAADIATAADGSGPLPRRKPGPEAAPQPR